MRLGVDTLRERLKGKDKKETTENYLLFLIFVGGLLFSIGMFSSIFIQKYIPALLCMFGSLVAFLSFIGIIILWILEEVKGE